MNIKKVLIAALTFGTTVAFAQGQSQKEDTFKSHWFIQAQVGAAHTVGEASFTDLMSPAAALNIGYKFTPVLGARIGGSGWQAKGSWISPKQNYKYNYLQGNIDIMADLSALFCGFNPNRVFNGYLFAGGGLNRGFNNDEANALDTRTYQMEYLWQQGKILPTGRFGLGCDLRLNDLLSINIEANANVLSDKFNSKKAGNCDWQLNALIGLSIKLGKSYKKTAPVYYKAEPAAPVQPAPVVEQPQPVEKVVEVAVIEPMKQNIFFAINSARISDEQQSKITSLVDYLTKYPSAKVTVTGYADKGTGTKSFNMKLSLSRAVKVADALKAKGISADRIVTEAKGDTVQPFTVSTENRVSICIAE